MGETETDTGHRRWSTLVIVLFVLGMTAVVLWTPLLTAIFVAFRLQLDPYLLSWEPRAAVGIITVAGTGWFYRDDLKEVARGDWASWWLILAGIFVLVVPPLYWLGTHLDALKAYGWPEAVLFGIVAAALLVLAAAIFMIAYRRFRPASINPWLADGVPQFDLGPDEQKESIRAIRDTLDAVVTTLDTHDPAHRMDALGAEIASVKQRIQSLEMAMYVHLYFSIAQTNYIQMGTLVASLPLKPSPLTFEWFGEARQFLNRVQFSGIGGERVPAFVQVALMAAQEVETELRTDKAAAPPAGVSVHDWREWLIAERQCDKGVAYLIAARKELEDELGGYYRGKLNELHERYTPKQG
jgi:hypothetical protein